MGTLYDLFRMGLDAIGARLPFRLMTRVSGDPATIFVSVINHTKDIPLFIHAVRIHFGQYDYTYSFLLEPSNTQRVEPRNQKDFYISFASGSRMQRRLLVDKALPGHDNFPSFDHPAQLFHAIANGPKKRSWIEIDFNEFKQRRFHRGKMKLLFQRVLEIGKERALARAT